jgi:hypothetical protein
MHWFLYWLWRLGDKYRIYLGVWVSSLRNLLYTSTFWKSWNWFEWLWVAYATHSTIKPVPTLPRKRQIAVTVWQIPDAVDTVICAPNDGWWYHPKHVEQFPDKINCVTLHLVGRILEYDSSIFVLFLHTVS